MRSRLPTTNDTPAMQQRVITIVLLIGLFFSLSLLVSGMSGWRLPDDQQGYAPVQPIAYSHRLHAGELQIKCGFCHSAATMSQYAAIPSSDVCMKCHAFVTASFNVMREELRLADETKNLLAKVEGKPESEIPALTKQALEDLHEQSDALQIPSDQLKILYDSLGLDDQLQPIEGKTPKSIPWVRVHNLPDYVCFNHQAHVTAGVTCQRCHGPVETMDRVRQFASLSMGWCVNCHREASERGIDGHPVSASINCTVCHH
ncbi:MAG: cytochrome c3 family protein [Pirellulales bacterium]|nr:cytochrome c3 family protein [Pirellulales bacterium]HJN66146.1 cytochrome c3 family protein [Pirellulales bacterium]